jgi:hypothetical protein
MARFQGSKKMSRFPMFSRYFASLPRLSASKTLLAIAALAAFGLADAAPAWAGAYDGTWNVTFTPQAGNCHASNTVPFFVSGSRVSSAGGGRVSGGVSRNGSVSVTITVGASRASGSGRLAGNAGVGRWSGIITGDRCSGSWVASRG